MKKIVAIVLVLVASAAAVWQFTKGDGKPTTSYRFVEVQKGDLEAVVSATGTLNAVTVVQVGTQVSGIVERIYVDFNDRVRRGQLLARIDTTLLISAMQDARNTLERNIAQRDYAQVELNRIQALFEKSYATEVELNKAKYDLQVGEASVKSAETNLERAQRNLSYATIWSPIDGVVVERNVEPGQTVAASFSAPQLFLIANDLSRMQILASVDESDIGRIHDGQTVRFTVQAFDERQFEGIVRQVRLQSKVQDNVVTYTVVVDVDNTTGELLPGMTATVEFMVETVTDVFKVANAALRFRATEEMMAEFRTRMQAQREASGDTSRAGRSAAAAPGGAGQAGQAGGTAAVQGQSGAGAATAGSGQNGGAPGGGSGRTMLWYLDPEGKLQATFVQTGLSDGSMTEISGRNLEAGMQIISGISQSDDAAATANPFQQQRTTQGGPPRPGF
jgi:HlyD family secretion protein